jgi:sugar phosphate isomerase/epimerase
MTIPLVLTVPPGAEPTLAQAIAWAQALGLGALELPVEWAPRAAEIAPVLAAAGLAVAGVAGHVRLNGADVQDFQRQAIQEIHAAAELGSPCLRVWAYDVARGQTRGSAITQIGQRLATLGAIGQDQPRPVRVVLENGGSFVRPRDLWHIWEVAQSLRGSACAGLAWNALGGIAHGEDPALAVPTLGSRLHYGRIGAVDLLELERLLTLAGTEARKIRSFLQRLRGIGYSGTLSVGALPTDASAAPPATLQQTIVTLKEWAGQAPPPPPSPAKPAEPKPAAAKAAPAAPAAPTA